MNEELTSCIHVNHWKNSSVLIRWLRNTENKSNCLFIVFDIDQNQLKNSKRSCYPFGFSKRNLQSRIKKTNDDPL